jgi:hypothetical protein
MGRDEYIKRIEFKVTRLTSRFFPLAWLALFLAVAMQLYRLCTVLADNGETPFLSANDRSRWCAIAALIEDRSFIIDRLLDIRDQATGRRQIWKSIDMVRKPEPDGTEHYYSSKPPFLTVIHAAICSPLTVILNRRLTDDPLLVGRTLIGIVQLLPLVMVWILTARWIDRNLVSLWGKWLLWFACLFGTFLSTFSSTLNNHLPAALCMIASVWLIERWITKLGSQTSSTETGQQPAIALCIAIGFFGALTAAFELPALAWAAAILGLLFILSGWRASAFAGLGMIPVALGFAITNYIALGDLSPAYAHREVLGQQLTTVTNQKPGDLPTVEEIAEALRREDFAIEEPFAIRQARRANTWEFSALNSNLDRKPIRFAVVPNGETWSLHRWNDWYDYPKSYWLPENKRGVDLGEPSVAAYAFHVLIGHYGIFSLTPFWLASIVGAAMLLKDRQESNRWWLTLTIIMTSIVCIGFYLSRPLIDRNYGGVCSGFRWQFWLIPAWLWLAAPAANYSGNRTWGRVVLGTLLAVSIFSATYPWSNPWQHPWIYTWLINR